MYGSTPLYGMNKRVVGNAPTNEEIHESNFFK